MLIPLHHWGIIFKQLVWLDGFEPTAFCTSSRCTYPLYDNHIFQKWCLPDSNAHSCFTRMVSVMFQSQVLLSGKRSSVYTPFFIRRLDIIYFNQLCTRKRIRTAILNLGGSRSSLELSRHHYILTTNTVPNLKQRSQSYGRFMNISVFVREFGRESNLVLFP